MVEIKIEGILYPKKLLRSTSKCRRWDFEGDGNGLLDLVDAFVSVLDIEEIDHSQFLLSTGLI